jgi:hypothetical protein
MRFVGGAIRDVLWFDVHLLRFRELIFNSKYVTNVWIENLRRETFERRERSPITISARILRLALFFEMHLFHFVRLSPRDVFCHIRTQGTSFRKALFYSLFFRVVSAILTFPGLRQKRFFSAPNSQSMAGYRLGRETLSDLGCERNGEEPEREQHDR